MKNSIERKDTYSLMNIASNKKNSLIGNKKMPLIEQNDYNIKKKNTISFNKHPSHRSFFVNLLKQRNLLKKNLKKEITKERVIELLSKDYSSRTNIENKEIEIYLSTKFDFFKKIKEENGLSKLDKVISICHLKEYINDDIIINYEEKESKIFILLKGNLGIYKPKFIEKTLALGDFLDLLNLIENKENNYSKYMRIKEKNKENAINISFYEKMNNGEAIMNQNFDFYLEDYEKIGNYSEGKVFGLNINENNNKISDVAIKSDKKSILLFFDIEDYKKISKRYEGKKYKKEIDKFRNDYPFFKYFSDDKIIDIFRICSTETIYKDEYLYKQNDKADKIFFIIKGKFNMYSSISFNWLNDYLDYIKDSKTNLIYHLIKTMPKNKDECIDLVEELKKKVIKSPMIKENISNIEKINEKINENNIYGVKNEEENINGAQKLFKINIKNIKNGDMVGLEDSIEIKNRYCSVKCISNVGEVKYISIYDLMKIIKIYNNENNYMNNHLLEFISKIKLMLYQQIIKIAQNLENKLTVDFDNKYNDLIQPNKEKKSLNEKNLSIAAIKVKGFRYDIKEVFDSNIPIFPNYKKSNSENFFLKNQLLLKNLLGSPKKKNRSIFKYKQQNSNPIIFYNNYNTINIENNNNKDFSNIYRNDIYIIDKCNTYIPRKKMDISLSTNFSNNIHNINNNQNNFFNHSKSKKGRMKLRLSSNKIIKNQTIKNYLNSFENIKETKDNNNIIQLFHNYNYNKDKKINNFIIDNSSLLSKNNKESRNNRNINYCNSLFEENKNYHSVKNIKNEKKFNKECIETILSEKFGKINKKYYLGNQFKNKLDKEKKKFNLIHYKEYFNKL